jgi:hypothetical protein
VKAKMVTENKYAESFKVASRKFRKTAKERGLDRVQSTWVDGKLKKKIVEIKNTFPSWEAFLQDVVKTYSNRVKSD